MNDSIVQPDRTGYGFLVIQTRMGSGAFPVEGVEVTVRNAREGGDNEPQNLVTDINGNTIRIQLPTPRAELSRHPSTQEDSYATYNIEVKKDGFRIKEFFNVPIFEGQTSWQIVRMQPLSQGLMQEEIVNTVEPDDL